MTDAMTDDLIRAVAGALRATANRVPKALSKGHPWYADYADDACGDLEAVSVARIIAALREGE
jgi:hypothetical protein